jgi:hypothetical protein
MQVTTFEFRAKKHVSDSFGGVGRNRWKRQHENQQGTTNGEWAEM